MPFYICVSIHYHGFEVVVVFDSAGDLFLVFEPLRKRNLAVFTDWVLHFVVSFEVFEEWLPLQQHIRKTHSAYLISSWWAG